MPSLFYYPVPGEEERVLSAKIKAVAPGSPCDGKIEAGETLVRIDGAEIHDVLDYMYYGSEPKLTLLIEDARGKARKVRVRK